DQRLLADNPARALTSVVRQTPSTRPTNADTLVCRVTFSEAVSGADAADSAVTGTTAGVSAVTLVSVGVYDVTVSGGNLASLNGRSEERRVRGESITGVGGNHLKAGSEGTHQELSGGTQSASRG